MQLTLMGDPVKKLVLVAGVIAAVGVTFAPVAVAQTIPTVPTCSQSLDQLAAARALPQGDVATKQILLDQATAAQIPLAKAVVDAQKAFDNNVDPTQVAALQAALNTAKANAAAGQAKIDAAVTALAAEKKLAADRDAAVKAGQAAVDKYCSSGGTTVTMTPAPTTSPVPTVSPTTVPIPRSINTGWAA